MKDFAGFMKAMTLEDAKKTADLANQIGRKAKSANLRFAYHNHFFEFVDQGNGRIAYDILLEETDPELVDFETDCGQGRLSVLAFHVNRKPRQSRWSKLRLIVDTARSKMHRSLRR